jgi:hypothetical protein
MKADTGIQTIEAKISWMLEDKMYNYMYRIKGQDGRLVLSNQW